MGRAKKAKGSAKRAPGTAAGKEQAAAREDVEALLVAAEDALDRMEHGDALELLRRARSAEREGDRAASRLGELLADMGRGEEAVRVLLEAVERCPEAGHEKFMHLGQLLAEPDEARAMLARGTALLRAHAGDAARMGLPEAAHLRGQLISALCAAAELELRACAEAASPEDRDAAASACDRLVSDAIECDADSPDPYQVLCSLRIEQDRREEAGRALQACTDRTDAIMGEAALLNAIQAGLTFGHTDHAAAAREPPSFEFRYENAKLLLELGRPGRAAATLEALVEECDDNPDVWYLLGLAYHLKRDGEAAAECLERRKKQWQPQPRRTVAAVAASAAAERPRHSSASCWRKSIKKSETTRNRARARRPPGTPPGPRTMSRIACWSRTRTRNYRRRTMRWTMRTESKK